MIRRLSLLLPLTALAANLACQAPFGAQRQELVGDRIAAVWLEPNGDEALAHAAIVVDGAVWSDAEVDLAWTWLDGVDVRDLPADHVPDATGPRPRLTVPDGGGTLGLVATFPEGVVREAVLDMPEGLQARGTFTGIDVAEVTFTAPEGEDLVLSLETREGAPTRDVAFTEPVARDGWLRLTPRYDSDPTRTRTRWMGTAGTFLELDTDVVDLNPATIELDDFEIVSSEPGPRGPLTLLALGLDELGGNTVGVRDLWVGDDPPTGTWIAGRWVAIDTDPGLVEGDWVTGTVLLDDDATAGFRLAGFTQVPPPTDADLHPALSCAGDTTGPFDPSWLLDRTCTRADLDGQNVTAQVSW